MHATAVFFLMCTYVCAPTVPVDCTVGFSSSTINNFMEDDEDGAEICIRLTSPTATTVNVGVRIVTSDITAIGELFLHLFCFTLLWVLCSRCLIILVWYIFLSVLYHFNAMM